MAANFNYFVQ